MNGQYQYENGAIVVSLEPKDYPLHKAAFDNNVEEVRRLLAEGLVKVKYLIEFLGSVDIAKRNGAGHTALHIAAMLGSTGK